MQLRVVGSGELTAARLAEVRGLLDGAFEDGFDEHDWAHALGGTHVLALDGSTVIGHASVVERTLWYGDQPLRTGYVEAVAVRHGHRRSGCGSALMKQVAVLVERYELGALATSEEAMDFYRRLGWRLWLGPTHVATPDGRVPTPDDDGGIFVLARGRLDLTAPLTCDWRAGDVW